MTLKAWFVTSAVLLLACTSAVTALPAEAATAPQFTGTQLLSALLPPSYFGAGMSVTKNSITDSGSHLEHGPAKYSLARSSCSDFYSDVTGWGETAVADDTVGNSNKKLTVWYSQEVSQFASPAAAAAYFHGNYSAIHRCASMVFSGGVTIRYATQGVSYGRTGSFQSFTADQSVTFSSPRVVNHFYELYVLDGVDVYELVPSSLTTPNASIAAPMFNALRARVGRL